MKQKGFAQALILIVVIAGLIVGVYLVRQTTDILPEARGPSRSLPAEIIENVENRVPPIENKDDLLNRLRDLESEDINSLEQGISQNETDSTGF